MTRIIRQIYSGKTFTVISETPTVLIVRPIPDDGKADIAIGRSQYITHFEDASAATSERKPEARGKALAKPESKKKGRR